MPRIDTGRTLLVLLASVTMFAPMTAQQPRTTAAKGGDDRNGAYDGVANWWKAAPEHDSVWTWGEVSGVAADTPDRIIVAIWGDRESPESAAAQRDQLPRRRQSKWRHHGAMAAVGLDRGSRPPGLYQPAIPSVACGSSNAAAVATLPCRCSNSPTTERSLVMKLGDGGDPKNAR